jgi:hypothetical protein
MYWRNVSKLAEDFREGRVEEKEKFNYFLATSVFWFIMAEPFFFYGQTFKTMDVISAAAGLTITIIGIILCYRANRSGDNTDFVGRMICLGWPILIKLAVLFLTIGAVIFILIQMLMESALEANQARSKQRMPFWSFFGSVCSEPITIG